jgi:acetyl-CoA synthetase
MKNVHSSSPFQSMQDYERLYKEASEDRLGFWKKQADAEIQWMKPYSEVLRWKSPFAEWFVGGKLNASAQCLDRHEGTPTWEKTALIFESEAGAVRKYTYSQMTTEVARLARGLLNLGVQAGDLVTIYMPLVPECIFAMLACARVGAVHSVVFGGFSAEALKDRILDAKSKLVITADGGFRRGQVIPMKSNVDLAVAQCPTVQAVLVLKCTSSKVEMTAGRDHWWSDVLAKVEGPLAKPCERDSEDLLFTLYTSGTTGKPKGIMHTHAGYLLWTKQTTKWVFDLRPNDIYWCTADVGWITGHSYLVYGPLQAGATIFMYEGAPNHPDWGRFWQMIEKHKINILYTAPTAIRAFMGQGDELPNKYDLSSLRLLGTVGEPINPEAWNWYDRVIGKGRCPIVDTWWQTETGGIMISPLPGVTKTKAGSCTRPLPGVAAKVIQRDGRLSAANEGGFLVITQPWPGMLRGIYGDPERFKKTYWSEFPGMYCTGDGGRVDEDLYFWVLGRVDDVINVSGHRLGTAEVESALVSHPAVVEAAVVGRPDPIKGQAIVAFVTLSQSHLPSGVKNPEEDWPDKVDFIKKLKDHVVKEIGALARPEDIRISQSLPKTRSGKIMRRLLREIATTGVAKGDTTTLEDSQVLERLIQQEEEA